MSHKSRDSKNRWRNKTIGFRVSPQEYNDINHMVMISGMTKQDYISARIHDKEITVHPNPRVYKGLKTLMQEVLDSLNKFESLPDEGLQETIRIVAKALEQMKGD